MPKSEKFKSLGEELEYSMYITKGARFNAHKRYAAKSRLSNLTIALLTSYIIIVNLVGLSQTCLEEQYTYDSTFIALISTALSILVLVFSQIEHSNRYRAEAEKYHQCAKEISALYYELRQVMQSEKMTADEKENAYSNYRRDYAGIISRFDNHHTLDYLKHQIEHPRDFQLSWRRKLQIRAYAYIYTNLLYHLLIILPMFWFIWFIS